MSELYLIPVGQDRKRTAFHEAGHAVLFAVLNIPFKNVYLNGISQTTLLNKAGEEVPVKKIVSGITFLSPDTGPHPEQQAICRMAGPLAEAVLIGGPDEQIRTSGRLDMESAFSFCRSEDLFEELKKQAEELVKENWPLIEAVAKELDEKGKLSYAEIVAHVRGETI